MNRIVLYVPLLLGLNGCIFRANPFAPWWEDDSGHDDGRDDYDDFDSADSADSGDTDTAVVVDTGILTGSVSLDPTWGAPGETVIVSIESAGVPDLSQVHELLFYGEPDVELVAVRERDEHELIIVLDVAAGSPEGVLDLLIRQDGGGGTFIEDAFYVRASSTP